VPNNRTITPTSKNGRLHPNIVEIGPNKIFPKGAAMRIDLSLKVSCLPYVKQNIPKSFLSENKGPLMP